MKDTVLNNKVIKFLGEMAELYQTFPQTFTAQETAKEVGGVTTRIGFISSDVIKELNARGIDVVYNKGSNPRKFIIRGVSKAINNEAVKSICIPVLLEVNPLANTGRASFYLEEGQI